MASSVSLYLVEEDTPEQLVLRARRFSSFLGGALLSVMGLGGLTAAWISASPSNPLWVPVGAGIFGAWLLAGSVALIRHGFTNKDRIVIDRAGAAIRFDRTDASERFAIPFREIERLDLRTEDRSTQDSTLIVDVLYVVRSGGDEFKVDESSDHARMRELAPTEDPDADRHRG